MKEIKKLYQINASKYILIPAMFLKILSIDEKVVLTLDLENKSIIIKKNDEVI